MIMYYKSENQDELINLLLSKAQKENLTVSLCFKNEEECSKFSQELWKSNKAIPHGVIGDKYQNLQPIWIDTKLDLNRIVAIVVGDILEKEISEAENIYEKIFFINRTSPIGVDNKNHVCWEYKNKQWNKVDSTIFFTNTHIF